MLWVGLTGGIGSGKSTVAARLGEHGAVVLDADSISREVVEPGTEGLAEVVATFGTDVLTSDGALDRQALAARAFADDESRLRLNAIVHPRVAARTNELIAQAAPDAVLVHDIPLLVEGGLGASYHLVVVVDADEDIRVRRLADARRMDVADARARVAAQSTPEQRRAAADVWLDNSAAPDIVLSMVDALWADRLVPFEANIRLRRPRGSHAPRLCSYNDEWPAQAERAIARVRLAAGEHALRVDHIGSTSVPGLPAQDVLDVQLIVRTLREADELSDTLSEAGFPRAVGEHYDEPQEAGAYWPKRFHYGADPARAINLYVRSLETPAWRRALLFAAWLRACDEERAAYARVKSDLAKRHASGTTDAYAADKQEWITAAFDRAERWAARTGWTVTPTDSDEQP